MADQNKQSGNYYVPDFSEEQEQGPKKYKNWPRSTRIIWIITTVLTIIMLLVLYSLNDSGGVSRITRSTAPPVAMESLFPARGPYSDPNILRDFLYGDREEPARAGAASGDAGQAGYVSQQLPAVPVAAPGMGMERPAPADRPKPKIVRKPPSSALLAARGLSAAAMAAAPEVALSSVAGGGQGDSSSSEPPAPGASDPLAALASQLAGTPESAAAIAGLLQQKSPGEDANATSVAHQDRNESFVKNSTGSGLGGEYLSSTRRDPVSRYELKAGSIINGVMMGGINSDLPGTILGQISEHVYDTATGGHILIPQGSRMVGTYASHIVYGQNRILVVWNRIIYPDGSSLNLEGMLGSDQSGYAGFKQKVDNHYSRLIGATLFASVFVAAGKEATKNDNTNSDSRNGDDRSTRSIFAEAVMENTTNIATRFIDRNLNVAPTLRILPGYRFIIVTTKDVAFASPYIVSPRSGRR
jgi:type IV secretion system protein VirB10